MKGVQKVERKIQEAKKEQKEWNKFLNDRDKELQQMSLARDKGLCGCGVQCGSFGTASLLCTQSIVSLRLASFPGHTPTKKSGLVWYPLFAHACNFPRNLGNHELLCYIRI